MYNPKIDITLTLEEIQIVAKALRLYEESLNLEYPELDNSLEGILFNHEVST